MFEPMTQYEYGEKYTTRSLRICNLHQTDAIYWGDWTKEDNASIHVARMEEMRNSYKILDEIFYVTPKRNGRMIPKLILRMWTGYKRNTIR
jgi:hypothetical protein